MILFSGRVWDLLRDDGVEVIECATSEAAELVIATSGTELRAWTRTKILTARCLDQNSGRLRGKNLPSGAASISSRRRACCVACGNRLVDSANRAGEPSEAVDTNEGLPF